jgi:hypothetical protein
VVAVRATAAANAIGLKNSRGSAGGATKFGETGLGTCRCFVCLVNPTNLSHVPKLDVEISPFIAPHELLTQRYLDRRLHQGQVLEVQEAEPLAKSLRLVLALYAETELCMQRPESGFETAQRFVGIE